MVRTRYARSKKRGPAYMKKQPPALTPGAVVLWDERRTVSLKDFIRTQKPLHLH